MTYDINGNSGKRTRARHQLRFDGTVTWGNILQAGIILAAILALWVNSQVQLSKFDGRLTAVEKNQIEQSAAMTRLSSIQESLQINQATQTAILDEIAKRTHSQ